MPEWFDVPVAYRPSHDRVGLLQDGRLIAMGKNYVVTTFPRGQGGCEYLNVRIPDLRMVEYVLNVQITTSPLDCTYPIYEAVNKKITGNVVGMTIFGAEFATGTTLTAEVIAIGPP
jgi:hypothetical protein